MSSRTRNALTAVGLALLMGTGGCLVGHTRATVAYGRPAYYPTYYPHAGMRYDNGYWVTRDGRYYSHDRHRNSWQYGRRHDYGRSPGHRHNRWR